MSTKMGHVSSNVVFACSYNYSSLSMHTPNLKSVAVANSKKWTKFQYLKVGQCDLDYIPLLPTFVSLILYSLQSIHMQNLNPIALAV